jgi:hypothetical protein
LQLQLDALERQLFAFSLWCKGCASGVLNRISERVDSTRFGSLELLLPLTKAHFPFELTHLVLCLFFVCFALPPLSLQQPVPPLILQLMLCLFLVCFAVHVCLFFVGFAVPLLILQQPVPLLVLNLLLKTVLLCLPVPPLILQQPVPLLVFQLMLCLFLVCFAVPLCLFLVCFTVPLLVLQQPLLFLALQQPVPPLILKCRSYAHFRFHALHLLCQLHLLL